MMTLQDRILRIISERPMSPRALYGSMAQLSGREALDAAVKALRARRQLVPECGHFDRPRTRPGPGKPPKGQSRPKSSALPGEPLTLREVEVADLAAAGRSSRDIASLLGVTLKTVTGHLSCIYAKLGIEGRKELSAALSQREGAA